MLVVSVLHFLLARLLASAACQRLRSVEMALPVLAVTVLLLPPVDVAVPAVTVALALLTVNKSFALAVLVMHFLLALLLPPAAC